MDKGYRHIEKELELVEMVGLKLGDNSENQHQQSELNGHSQNTPNSSGGDTRRNINDVVTSGSSYKTLVLACMIAAGVQFGWALQLSLLTPYIQTLGIDHAFASFIWLCGPITGLVVQPCVGIWSDKCHSKFGRRRPFILIGSVLISVAVTMVGFSADIGYILGDTNEHCSNYKGPRWRAVSVFVIGFWMLDLANNTVQGPARALLADLSGPDQCNYANAIFCSWMALGNILGFSAGSGGQWYRWFPFLNTRACCEACANLKGAFVVSVVFLMFCTFVTLYFAKETPLVYVGNNLSDTAPLLNDSRQLHNVQLSTADIWSGDKNGSEASMATHKNNIENSSLSNAEGGVEALVDEPSGVLVNLLTSLRHLAPGMNAVLVVMAFTWMAWFPFFLYDTDWMGRAVYHGNPNGNSTEVQNYDKGVRDGAFGLLLNSVVLLFSSFGVEPMCKILGAKVVWGISNFIIFACMLSTVFISFLSKGSEMNGTIRVASLLLFSILGVPLSITYSVPFSMTAELTADTGGGQGLATGVLNLAIVIPQMILSLGAGPLDAIFESGNDPAFILASAFSLVGGIIAITKLPTLSYRSPGLHGFA